MNQGLSSYHAQLLHPAEGYAPFGEAGPVMNAEQLHHLRALSAPGPQYRAVTPQAAQLAAALLGHGGRR